MHLDFFYNTDLPIASFYISTYTYKNLYFRGKAAPIRKHCGLLQVTQAVLETLQHPSGDRQDSLLAVEKGLLQVLSEAQNGELLWKLTQTVSRETDRPTNER